MVRIMIHKPMARSKSLITLKWAIVEVFSMG